MMEFLYAIEHSNLAVAVKESAVLYDIPLVLHGLGMGILVGLSAAICLRILGVASELPLAPLEQFYPWMWFGFWVNAASGVTLYLLYPTKATVNPGFYIKLGAIATAVVLMRKIKAEVFGRAAARTSGPANGKTLAFSALVAWMVALTAGRLMAYHPSTPVELHSAFVVLLLSVLMLAAYAAVRRVRAEPAEGTFHSSALKKEKTAVRN